MKIGGKGNEKAVVGTVFVAESESVRDLRSEDEAEQRTSAIASRDASKVRGPVKEERPVAVPVTVRPSQDKESPCRPI